MNATPEIKAHTKTNDLVEQVCFHAKKKYENSLYLNEF